MKTTAPCSHAFSGISRKGQTTTRGRSAGPSREQRPPDEARHAVRHEGLHHLEELLGRQVPAVLVPLAHQAEHRVKHERGQVLDIGLVLGHSCDLQEERHHGSLHLHEEPWVALVAQQHEHLLVVRGEQLRAPHRELVQAARQPRPDDGRRIALELAQQLVLQLIEQVVHVGEVLVERSAVVAGVLGHRSHRHAVDAIVAVQLPERVHELLARLRRLLRLLLHGNASDRPTLASKLSVDVRAY